MYSWTKFAQKIRMCVVGQSKSFECVPLRIATSDVAAIKMDVEIPKLLSYKTVFYRFVILYSYISLLELVLYNKYYDLFLVSSVDCGIEPRLLIPCLSAN
jgi:hypothetical protein